MFLFLIRQKNPCHTGHGVLDKSQARRCVICCQNSNLFWKNTRGNREKLCLRGFKQLWLSWNGCEIFHR